MIDTYRGVAFPWLCDQMGHLTTSRYVEMFDVAAYHLFHNLGLVHEPEQHLGLADVRQELDYEAEVKVGGLIMIKSGLLTWGPTSIRARHQMFDLNGRYKVATLEAVTVRFDLRVRKAIELPRDFSDAATPLLIGDVY